MTFARTERRLLADSLLQAGPDAPTVCEGWQAKDLAAHIVVRDRRADAALAGFVPPLAARGERILRATAERPYPELIDAVRTPPWWSPLSNPLTDQAANTNEMFIHHEDIRRAQTGWEPRPLDPADELTLWKTVKLFARLALRSYQPVRLEAPGYGVLQLRDGEPRATLTGPPGELALFLSGRQRVAHVEVTGDESLRTAKLGR
ncbi:TIGR03085 family metal-binding protein [Symbioplanes lichenis]|uniref:TIGR03085 family metal-binding protein n=1 Tax=Symbioplanes lichenis TaxID=1629072 RepID=UPI00273935FE|nr:TIGR03085 family metal-binding protein [Actinoplanes lichenis]